MKTNFEALQEKELVEFAEAIVFDENGEMLSRCNLCQRSKDGNCDDNCFGGVIDYLQGGVEE